MVRHLLFPDSKGTLTSKQSPELSCPACSGRGGPKRFPPRMFSGPTGSDNMVSARVHPKVHLPTCYDR